MLPNIWITFARKFISKNVKKLPNLVTLSWREIQICGGAKKLSAMSGNFTNRLILMIRQKCKAKVRRITPPNCVM